jgi:putative membrane protein insertion efficiency factor
MPSLRIRRLTRKDKLALAALAAFTVCFCLDAMRPPASQLSVHAFAASVEGYHHFIHPVTGRFIRCRYRPTCSNYAVQATRKYGMVKGGWMGLKRLLSCQPGVPMGTVDPVP